MFLGCEEVKDELKNIKKKDRIYRGKIKSSKGKIKVEEPLLYMSMFVSWF